MELLEAQARQITGAGYAVLELTHSAAEVAELRDALAAIHRAHGCPTPYAPKNRALAPEVELSPTGFVIFKLLKLCPALADVLFKPDVVDVARRVLGADMHLELTGAVISDASRPFFSWHNHIGGIDVEDYRARREWPRFAVSERLIAVLYLDDVDARGGEIVALPRRVTDPTEAPFDPMLEHWAGAVSLGFPRGSTLIFEQCTWHAVRQQRTPGLRMFVGCYFTAARAPKTAAVDESLAGLRTDNALLRSLLPRAV